MPFLFLAALAALILLGVLYSRSSAQLAAIKDPTTAAELQRQETENIVSQVSKHIILPIGETPVLATVTEASELAKQQPFYTDARNGDKLLIYIQSQKAILYSPSRNLIVNVGPVVGENADQPEATQ